MTLLKKENWIVCLILSIITQGLFTFVLAYLMKIYDKKAWYCKWQYWVFGTLCLIFPALIMLEVFTIQITIKIAVSLDVPGKKIYTSPYIWILLLIIPIIGWILLVFMLLYIEIFTIVMLYKGSGEKYLKCN